MKGGRRAGEGKHAKQMGEFLAACEMDWESGRSYSRYQGGDWNKYACTHAWRKAKKDRQEEKEIEYIVFPGTKLC